MFKVHDTYNGFYLEEKQNIAELQAVGYLFRHVKSGARLFFVANDDDNKVFSISFRTPPRDSSGVAHILEHSVLCGSRKYPLREPFVELVKGSLNTFLNAITFSDKTMYPIASRNDKDFRNLMDVYLDAVFYPDIYDVPEIMMQEGWHYDLHQCKDDLIYKGVVYNEMKGVYSSPDAILERAVQDSLFPDTTYGVESGGEPEAIPQLSQKAFEKFHKTYYHPANSYIFLYGNADILTQLQFLDKEYLSNFTRIAVDSRITEQQPFERTVEKIVPYPVSMDESLSHKTFLSLNFVVGKAVDPEAYLAFQILEHMLLETPAAPLKKALLEAGIGEDVFGAYNQELLQPSLMVAVRGSEAVHKQKFISTVYRTLQQLVLDGLDERLVASSLNRLEFGLREANFGNYPKGLIYNIKCMDSWLYDASPFMHLAYEQPLAAIKHQLSNRYFERLIETQLLDNTHRSCVVLIPQRGLEEQRAKSIADKLADIKADMSSAEIEAIIAKTQQLEKRQTTPDTPEQLATIPLLKLEDISKQAEHLPLEKLQAAGAEVLFHQLPTNDITYLNLYFDTRMVPAEQLHFLYLLSAVLGKLDTAQHSYSELSNDINIYTGGISFRAEAFASYRQAGAIYPKFIVKAKVLNDKLPRLAELLADILLHSSFTGKRRLYEVISELKAKQEVSIMSAGHQITSLRVQSYFSQLGAYREHNGLSFYKFITGIVKDFDACYEQVAGALADVAAMVFNRRGLVVSVTADKSGYQSFSVIWPQFCNQLVSNAYHTQNYAFALARRNEGLMTSSKVQYVTKGNDLHRLGSHYHGALKVLETILRYDYLWNRIRIHGGAYGCFASFMRNGNFIFSSYRDPNLEDTLAVYNNLGRYLADFTVTEREMRKYIIGTISTLDAPLTPQMKGERAAEDYFRQFTWEDAQLEREQVLSTDEQCVRTFADIIDRGMAEDFLCVLGNEDRIKAAKSVFLSDSSIFA